MNFEQAKNRLNMAFRHELRDHAFGDREIFWTMGGREMAGGYMGRDKSVWIQDPHDPDEWISFNGEEAEKLANCGKLRRVDRNDSTGPDAYLGP